MSASQPTTTRRQVLGNALTAALAVTTATVLPATVQAAPEPTTARQDPLKTLAQTDADFAAWYERWRSSRPATASSSWRCEDAGSCQPVSSPSTARTPRWGVMSRLVQPCPADTVPSAVDR